MVLAPGQILPSVSNSGNSVFTTLIMKGGSIPLGMEVLNQISPPWDLWVFLRSYPFRWHLALILCAQQTKPGGHVLLQGLCCWNSLMLIAVTRSSLRLPGYSLLTSPRSNLCSLWKVSSVSAPASSFHMSSVSSVSPIAMPSSFSTSNARSRSPSRLQKPLVSLRPMGHVSSVVRAGASLVLLSARCVAFTVSVVS